MTDFDKKLVEKALRINRWYYRNINVLISIADTQEARERLTDIMYELRDLRDESL